MTAFIVAFGPILFWLLVAHVVCDYPLQGDFLARAKNSSTDLGLVYWKWALPSHALIQAGGSALVTGSVAVGMIEFVFHWLIDWAKCKDVISFECDQTLHVLCKVSYAAAIASIRVGYTDGALMALAAGSFLVQLVFTRGRSKNARQHRS